MKKLKKTLLALLLAGGFAGQGVAGINYLHLYLVGDATPAGWNENLPEEFASPEFGKFHWEGWLNEGQFKMLNTIGDWGTSLVAPESDLEFVSGQEYNILWNGDGNGNPDYKFVNAEAGYVSIDVNLNALKARMTRPALKLIGPAALGWYTDNRVIPVYPAADGSISWTGQLHQGELKFITGSDWVPSYNSTTDGEALTPGEHQMAHRTDYAQDDFKFVVEEAGLYTLTFDLDTPSVTVSMLESPDLHGQYTADAGRYLVAVDENTASVHVAPMPKQLYIGTGADDMVEIPGTGTPGVFSGEVPLYSDRVYRLCYDLSDVEGSTLSPNEDVNLSTGETSNVAPVSMGWYRVANTAFYQMDADFTNQTFPRLSATQLSATEVNAIDEVDPDSSSMEIYTLSGIRVPGRDLSALQPGMYLVKIIMHNATKVYKKIIN